MLEVNSLVGMHVLILFLFLLSLIFFCACWIVWLLCFCHFVIKCDIIIDAPILFLRRLHFPNTFAFLICFWTKWTWRVFVIHSHLHPLHLPFSFLSIFHFSSIFVSVPFLLAKTTTILYLRSSPSLHLLRVSFFNFEHLDILWVSFGHPS